MHDNLYTFQKPVTLHNLQNKDKNLKKLIISGLSTPKNKHYNLISGQHDERMQSSSTKKKNTDLRIT